MAETHGKEVEKELTANELESVAAGAASPAPVGIKSLGPTLKSWRAEIPEGMEEVG